MNDYGEISRCNRCGFCQSVCPTYAQSLDETQVARGRIHLLRLLTQGGYDWRHDPGISAKVDDCLLCRACVANCPSTVETDHLMRSARRDFLKIKGLSLFQHLVYRGGLSHRERLDRTSFLLRLYDKSGLRQAIYSQTLRRALDKLIYYESFLPSGLSAPAKASLPQVLHPTGKPKIKLVYFIGCASNVFGSAMVHSILDYLVRRGAEISLPNFACCGEPHYSAGDDQEAGRLAKLNAEKILAGHFDFIVSDCSTCAHSLAHYDRLMDPTSPLTERLRPHLGRVLEINTLVREHLPVDQASLKPLPNLTKVTYHDSCHAIRGLGVKKAPRELLKMIPGLDLVEMAGADSCCGGAGSYGLSHAEMSGRIVKAKIEGIKHTGANLLGLSCPACRLQLGAGLKREGMDLEVVHPVELLARSSS